MSEVQVGLLTILLMGALVIILAVCIWVEFRKLKKNEEKKYTHIPIQPPIQPIRFESVNVPINKIAASILLPMGRELQDDEIEIVLDKLGEKLGKEAIKLAVIRTQEDPCRMEKLVTAFVKIAGTPGSFKDIADELRK